MRIVLHIDMNSYFATVEQLANPFLRGKPIAIGGSVGTRGVVVAASMEAKQMGVKVGMNHPEAIQVCPHLQFIDGDPTKYQFITQTFIDIAKRYSEYIDVYSVDEVFLELTDLVPDIQGAIHIAKLLKQDLANEIGSYLTCSVGIARNRMMAKVASNMKKPDGLSIIDETNIKEVLDWIELTDIPGIGPRLKVRLFDMGIRTLSQLGNHPVTNLQRVFGPNYGTMLSEMGKGIDHTTISHISEVALTKSMGHTYTLKQDTYNRDEIYNTILKLGEKVGRRLRRDHYQGRMIWVWLRWADFSGTNGRVTLKQYTDNGYFIYKVAVSIMEGWDFPQPIRAVGVGARLLIHQGKQLPIFEQDKKQHRLQQAQDAINDRYGEFTIKPARIMHTGLTRKIGGFKEPHQFK